MPINLDAARRALERLMDDQVTITRDPQQTDDDTFDQATGQYTPPVGDVTTVYTGKALVSGRANVGTQGNRAGGSFQVVDYTLQIPIAAPALRAGDWVQVTSSLRDSTQVNKKFQIVAPIGGTLVFTRKATLIAEEAP